MKDIKEYVKYRKNNLKDIVEDKCFMPLQPALVILQVGNNEASNRYVRNKIKDCEEVGIKPILHKFDETCTEKDIIKMIKYNISINYLNNCELKGIMLQLPIPKHLNLDKIINEIPPEFDVDGFRKDSLYIPCTPKGIIDYLDYDGFNFDGADAVIIGRSNIVGKPLAKLLLDRNCTVTVCHSKTKDIKKFLKNADLVVVAAGHRGIINSQDALSAKIIDVGINFDKNGKLCGDVIVNPIDKDRVTPVPGGVGLLTRLALLENILN